MAVRRDNTKGPFGSAVDFQQAARTMDLRGKSLRAPRQDRLREEERRNA